MEEVLPPQTESGAGFELTRVRQFTVFMENQVGRLQALTGAYEQSGGKVIAVAVWNEADTALVRLICSDPDEGKIVLKEEGFSFSEQDLLAVELPAGSKHPLMTLCAALMTAELNIHYAYPLLIRPDRPAMAVLVDDPTLAAQILIRKGFRLLGESDLRKA